MPSWLRYLLWFGLAGPVIGYLTGSIAALLLSPSLDADLAAMWLIMTVVVAPIGLALGLVPALATGWVAYQLSRRGFPARIELALTVLCGEAVTAAGVAVLHPPGINTPWGHWTPGLPVVALIEGLVGAFTAAVCWRLARRRQAGVPDRRLVETPG